MRAVILVTTQIYMIRHQENGFVRSILQIPSPVSTRSHKAFADILAVSQDKQTSYVTVTIEHRSPIIAAVGGLAY